jgi:hypothetical protein
VAGTSLAVVTIASTIDAAIAPVFLLAGIGGILNVIAMRFSRAVDRTRALEAILGDAGSAERNRKVAELRLLNRRITHANRATTLCVASALAVCLVVILLFVSPLLRLDLGTAVALLFVLSMALLAGGLYEFLAEIRVAISALKVRDELLH